MSACERDCCLDDERAALESRLACLCIVCRDWIEENCHATRTVAREAEQSELDRFGGRP